MHCLTCHVLLPGPTTGNCPNCGSPVASRAYGGPSPFYHVVGLGQAVAWTVGGVTLLLGGIAVTTLIMKMTLWSETDEGEAAFDSATSLDVVLSVMVMLSFLAAAVLTIIWSFRARKNVDLIDTERMGIGPGWAIAGWLVPLANFVVPGLLLRGIARRSALGPGVLWAITGWWVAFVGGTIADRVITVRVGRLEREVLTGLTEIGTLLERLDSLLTARFVANLVMMVAGVLLIVIVLRISQAQHRRWNAQLASGMGWTGWPQTGVAMPVATGLVGTGPVAWPPAAQPAVPQSTWHYAASSQPAWPQPAAPVVTEPARLPTLPRPATPRD